MALILEEDLVELTCKLSEVHVLHQAILMKKYRITKSLLVGGYDADRVSKPNKMTPLMAACFLQDPRMSLKFVILLLKHNASPFKTDSKGRNFLHYAAANKLANVCAVVLKVSDFKLDVQDVHGNTVLHTSAMAGDMWVMQLFVEYFTKYVVSVNTKNNLALTPLLLALLNSNLECAVVLQRVGGSPVLDDERFERIVHSLRQNMSLSAVEKRLVSKLKSKKLSQFTKAVDSDARFKSSHFRFSKDILPKASWGEPSASISSALSSLRSAACDKPDVFQAISQLRCSCPSLSYSLRCVANEQVQKRPKSHEDDTSKVNASSLPLDSHSFEPICCIRREHVYQFTPSYRNACHYKAPVDDRWIATVYSYTCSPSPSALTETTPVTSAKGPKKPMKRQSSGILKNRLPKLSGNPSLLSATAE